MIPAVPDVEAVNVVMHVAIPSPDPIARLHGVNVPATPPIVKLTDPVGVVNVPVPPVVVTVAVQATGWLRTAGLGLQVRFVDVLSWLCDA